MASINVRSEFYTAPETANKEAISSVIQQIRPVTGAVNGTATIPGDIILEWTTGSGQYCDLMKSHYVIKYTIVGASTHDHQNLAMCSFDRGQLYLNGKKVANSNYWTQDSVLSKRLNFSETYNSTVNNLRYIAPAEAADADCQGAGSYCDIDYLDALFLRTPSLIIPPNTNVRLILTGAPNALAKASRTTDTDPLAGTLVYKDFYLNGFFLNRAEPAPSEFVLKFVTMDTFKIVPGATVNNQVNSRNGLVRLAAYNQSTAVDTDAISKVYDATGFTYVTDGKGEAMMLENIQFKAGQQIIPNSAFNNTTYGFDDSYHMFINNSEAILDPAGHEFKADWLAQGPIYTVPIVRTAGNEIRNVELAAKYTAAPTANLYFVLMYEQYVSFQYGSAGQPLATEALI